jgi:hypothetical protein
MPSTLTQSPVSGQVSWASADTSWENITGEMSISNNAKVNPIARRKNLLFIFFLISFPDPFCRLIIEIELISNNQS